MHQTSAEVFSFGFSHFDDTHSRWETLWCLLLLTSLLNHCLVTVVMMICFEAVVDGMLFFFVLHSWNSSSYILRSHHRHHLSEMGSEEMWWERSLSNLQHHCLQVLGSSPHLTWIFAVQCGVGISKSSNTTNLYFCLFKNTGFQNKKLFFFLAVATSTSISNLKSHHVITSTDPKELDLN